MKRPALAVLQDTYQFVINPKHSYYEQLQSLSPSGDLSNKAALLKIIFDLCEVIDKQAGAMDSLQADQITVAKQIVSLEKSLKMFIEKQTKHPDPTKPLPTTS